MKLSLLIDLVTCLDHLLHSRNSYREVRSLPGTTTPSERMQLGRTKINEGEREEMP